MNGSLAEFQYIMSAGNGSELKFWKSAEPSVIKKLKKIPGKATESMKIDEESQPTSRDTSQKAADDYLALQVSNHRPSMSGALDVLMQEKERHKALQRKKSLDLARCLCSVPMTSKPKTPPEVGGALIQIGGKSLTTLQPSTALSKSSASVCASHSTFDHELSVFDKSCVLRSIRLMDRTPVSPMAPVCRKPATSRVSMLPAAEGDSTCQMLDSAFSAFTPTQQSVSIQRLSGKVRRSLKPTGLRDSKSLAAVRDAPPMLPTLPIIPSHPISFPAPSLSMRASIWVG
jgi:hypothetical protein